MTTTAISDQGAPPAPLAPPTWSETVLHLLWSSTGAFRSTRADRHLHLATWLAAWFELVACHMEIPSDQAVTDYLNVLFARHVAIPAMPDFHSAPYHQPLWAMLYEPGFLVWPEIG